MFLLTPVKYRKSLDDKVKDKCKDLLIMWEIDHCRTLIKLINYLVHTKNNQSLIFTGMS